MDVHHPLPVFISDSRLCTSALLPPCTVSSAPRLCPLSWCMCLSPTAVYLPQDSFLEGTEVPTVLYQMTSPGVGLGGHWRKKSFACPDKKLGVSGLV